MANQEHLLLSQYLKDVHQVLRETSQVKGAEDAWKEHCEKTDILKKYAKAMEKLATTHWQNNCENISSEATSRIEWAVNFINYYFIEEKWREFDNKELLIGSKIDINVQGVEHFMQPYKLLDVGSCYNPFRQYEFLDVLAIDLCPANNTVLECDFLAVETGSTTIKNGTRVQKLQENTFDVVTFCFLLEYIPTSDLRIKACQKAYLLLKPGGLLIISTPDSKHVGANSKLMKNWRYTLAEIGFNRIKYDKQRHMHCMVFRKSLHKDIASRWAKLHKEPNMSFSINIPQDFRICSEHNLDEQVCIEANLEDFKEMPFSED